MQKILTKMTFCDFQANNNFLVQLFSSIHNFSSPTVIFIPPAKIVQGKYDDDWKASANCRTWRFLQHCCQYVFNWLIFSIIGPHITFGSSKISERGGRDHDNFAKTSKYLNTIFTSQNTAKLERDDQFLQIFFQSSII